MKKVVLHITFQILTFVSFGQTQLLKDYDFNKGGYYLLGIRSEIARNNKLADTLGNFYTNEIKTLNEFKKEWVFKKPSPQYACGYHYTVHICKNGNSIEEFSINLECNEIATDKGYFYFDLNKLRIFKNNLKKAYKSRDNFSTLLEAREFRNKVLKDNNLILAPKPDWVEYEGSFNFDYPYTQDEIKDNDKNNKKDLEQINKVLAKGDYSGKFELESEKKYFKKLNDEIAKAYPNEKFELESSGGSKKELFVSVRCNSTLADKFNLYPKGWSKWQAYNLSLTTYWINKPK